MKDPRKLQDILQMHALNDKVQYIVQSKLVDTGLISRNEFVNAFRGNILVEQQNPAVLAAVYTTMYETFPEECFPNPNELFEQKELDARFLLKKEADQFASFPFVFENVVKLSNKQEFVFELTYQQLSQMSQHHLIKIKPDMQRESVIVKVGNVSVPCVSFDSNKAKEITDSILANKQFVTTVRFHLLPDPTDRNGSFAYDAEHKELTVKKGMLVNIDGNHRVNAILDALYYNPSLTGCVVVLFTIGDAQIARDIIIQEEKRTPIDQDHVASMRNIAANEIIEEIKNDPSFYGDWGFSKTEQQYVAGTGVFIESVFADALMKEFNIGTRITSKNKRQLVQYLLEVLKAYQIFVEQTYIDYYHQYAQHLNRLMVRPQFVYGLFYVANKIVSEDDWEDLLERTVQNINYETNTRALWFDYESICRDRFRKAYEKAKEGTP